VAVLVFAPFFASIHLLFAFVLFAVLVLVLMWAIFATDRTAFVVAHETRVARNGFAQMWGFLLLFLLFWRRDKSTQIAPHGL